VGCLSASDAPLLAPVVEECSFHRPSSPRVLRWFPRSSAPFWPFFIPVSTFLPTFRMPRGSFSSARQARPLFPQSFFFFVCDVVYSFLCLPSLLSGMAGTVARTSAPSPLWGVAKFNLPPKAGTFSPPPPFFLLSFFRCLPPSPFWKPGPTSLGVVCARYSFDLFGRPKGFISSLFPLMRVSFCRRSWTEPRPGRCFLTKVHRVLALRSEQGGSFFYDTPASRVNAGSVPLFSYL